MTAAWDLDAVRARFSSLRDGFAFLDAPGGSQTPDEVGRAIACALRTASANLGAGYPSSRRAGQILAAAERAAARLLGAEPDEITFGANMTSLNFALTRTASRDFARGDQILVSAADHDAGVAPWRELAADRGLELGEIALHPDTTLDFDSLAARLSERTQIVAVAAASNAVGTLVDLPRVAKLAHAVGARLWVDAVHLAAHEPIDVRRLGADVLLCSPYKFCGPHLGIAYVRRELAEGWRPYTTRPAAGQAGGRRLATGTPPFEQLAGLNATLAYLDSIGGFAAIRPHERGLGERFLAGLPGSITVHGPPTMDGRVPTFLITLDDVDAGHAARRLAQEHRIGVWAHDHWYSLGLRPYLAYPGQAVRVGFIHYNTADEVDRLLAGLAEVQASATGRPPAWP
jgi:cysteine desulfurase family protein (TIGR01976 family)